MNLSKKISFGIVLVFLFLFTLGFVVHVTKAANIIVSSDPLVDLTADAPTQTKASTLTPIEFDTNIHNIGSISTGTGFSNVWNISSSTDISSLITTLSSAYPIPVTAGGQTYSIQSPAYTFPTAGTFYVQACADSTSSVVETSETNNCSSWVAVSVVSTPLANLTADAPTQKLASTGTPIQFDTNIHNNGIISTGTGFTNSWKISTTSDGTSVSQTLASNYPIPVTAGGQTYSIQSPAYTFPTAGTFYVQACADSTSSVAETSETDNCSGWVGVVVSGPLVDLIADASTQNKASTLTPIEFDTNIHNIGSVSTGVGFNNSWKIASGSDGSGLMSTLQYNYPIPVTAGGQTYSIQSPAYTFPTAGTFYIQACADSTSSVAETSETNNCSSWVAVSVVAVPLADLTADDPAEKLASTQTPIQFSTNIHNIGSISTGEGFNNSWDISTTNSPTGIIKSLPSFYPIPVTAGGQTYKITSTSYQFTQTGTFYVRACADSTNIVAEVSETNNCSNWVGIVASICANGATDYPTCTPPPSDACGLSSSSTPQLVEPSGLNACTSGTYSNSPSDTTTSGAQAWNWSCGTVKTCSAPQFGCTTTDDINYNATGPNNIYACANKCSVKTDSNYNKAPCSHLCSNNGTDYPTCTPPVSICANGATDYPTCTPPTKCLVSTDTNYNKAGSCSGLCINSATNYPTCTPPIADSCSSLSGSIPQKTEPSGLNACTSGTYSNSPSDTTTSGAQAWNWSCGTVKTCSAPQFGCTTTDDINYNATGPNNIYACANKCSVKTDSNYNKAPCSHLCANGDTDYSTCIIPSVIPTGSLTGTNCDIVSGASSCNTTLVWNTLNPIGTSAVTTPTNITVLAANASKGTTYQVAFGTKDFYLYNNAISLAQISVVAACATGSSWTGTKCATVVDPTICLVKTDTNYNKVGACAGTCLNGAAKTTYPSCILSTSFDITATTGANGTVTPAGVSAVTSGGSKTYTITPSSGYAINSVLVDGTSVGTVSNYNFTNVTTSHTISATFKLNTCLAPLTQTVTVACDLNALGQSATSGLVTRLQTKTAPSCTFGSPVDVTNSTYVSDNCVYPNGGGNGTTTGTITTNASNCEIDFGNNSCTTTLIVNITNPINGAETKVTELPSKKEVISPSFITTFPTSKDGIVVTYPSTTFELDHNGAPLNEKLVSAVCKPNLIWDGSKCVGSWSNYTYDACTATACGEVGTQIGTRTCSVFGTCLGQAQKTQSCSVAGCPGGNNYLNLKVTATPSSIMKGKLSTINWESDAGSTCTSQQFNTGVGSPRSGSAKVNPTATTTYIISCDKDGLNDTQEITIKVDSLKIIEN